MFHEFANEIWTVDGPTVTAAMGFKYPTRMIVIRLDADALFVISPVALTEKISETIAKIGTVRFLVAPNTLHDRFLLEWSKAYPEALVYGPSALVEARRDIKFNGQLDQKAHAEWQSHLELVAIPGNRITDEVVIFHKHSGTAIFTDLLQQLPPRWFSGWRAVVARIDLMVASEVSVPRKFRIAFRDRRAARLAVAKVMAWPTIGVIFAHGTPIEQNGRAVIERAFRWLNPMEI